MHQTRVFIVAAALASAMAGAAAAQPAGTTFYGSLGYKQDEDLDLGAIQARVGASFTPHLAIEGELATGVKSYKLDMPPALFKRSLDYEAVIYGVGVLPISPNAELFARLGYGTSRMEFETNGGGVGPAISADRSFESVNYGVGGRYFFDEANGVRVDYTRQDFNKGLGTSDTWAVAYTRRF